MSARNAAQRSPAVANILGTAAAVREVYVILPGNVDDPAAPSGGNTYDRRVCRALAGSGWSVRELAVRGAWPRPGAPERAELAGALAALPDDAVVLLDGLVACGVPDVVVPHGGRLRLVVLVHMPLADETGLAPAEAAALDARERATLRAARAVVAPSAWAAGRLVAHHGLAADRVHVAVPGVDPAPLAGGTDGAAGLLCVAAVTPHKGHDVLVEALSGLAGTAWTCVCVGATDRDPAYVAALRAAIAAYHLGDRVRLVGPRTGGQLAAAYAAADLVVLASRSETYGMVVTEALARGVPVLTTAAGGAPEALGRAGDGDLPGMLVPPGDPTALAGALRRWFGEPELRRGLTRAARDRRGSLRGWAATARELAGVLDRLRHEPGRTR